MNRMHSRLAMNAAVAVAVAGLALVVRAAPEEPPIRSPMGQQAQSRYQKSMRDADEAYRQARLRAEQAYVDELTDALKSAMQGGNLDEAKALDDEKKAAALRVQTLRTGSILAGKPSVKLRYRSGSIYVLREDGSAGIERSNATGKWIQDGKRVVITWTSGYVDTLTPAGDGEFVVTNNKGARFEATRLADD